MLVFKGVHLQQVHFPASYVGLLESTSWESIFHPPVPPAELQFSPCHLRPWKNPMFPPPIPGKKTMGEPMSLKHRRTKTCGFYRFFVFFVVVFILENGEKWIQMVGNLPYLQKVLSLRSTPFWISQLMVLQLEIFADFLWQVSFQTFLLLLKLPSPFCSGTCGGIHCKSFQMYDETFWSTPNIHLYTGSFTTPGSFTIRPIILSQLFMIRKLFQAM